MGLWDILKQAAVDQMNGSAKYGASTSYRHNRAAMLAAKAEREAEEARRRRAAELAELERNGGVNVAGLRSFVEELQGYLDARTQRQRRQGHNIRRPKVYAGTFDGQPAIGKFFEGGDPDRLDIYYGGGTPNPLENEEHGHVVIDLKHPEVPRSWLKPGPKHYREQVI